eukprot:1156244-Pelagomonas_calceolata.AAC.14
MKHLEREVVCRALLLSEGRLTQRLGWLRPAPDFLLSTCRLKTISFRPDRASLAQKPSGHAFMTDSSCMQTPRVTGMTNGRLPDEQRRHCMLSTQKWTLASSLCNGPTASQFSAFLSLILKALNHYSLLQLDMVQMTMSVADDNLQTFATTSSQAATAAAEMRIDMKPKKQVGNTYANQP